MKLRDFDILFKGLSFGAHSFEFELDDRFFDLFNYTTYQGIHGVATVELVKSETLMDVHLSFKGSVRVPCDTTNELYDQALENEFPLEIKFADEFNDENEELLYLPHGEYKFNCAQYLYELAVLSIPTKLIGPNAEEDPVAWIEEAPEETKEEETDPRWGPLKNLLNNKD